jgi:hypothetical protein
MTRSAVAQEAIIQANEFIERIRHRRKIDSPRAVVTYSLSQELTKAQQTEVLDYFRSAEGGAWVGATIWRNELAAKGFVLMLTRRPPRARKPLQASSINAFLHQVKK